MSSSRAGNLGLPDDTVAGAGKRDSFGKRPSASSKRKQTDRPAGGGVNPLALIHSMLNGSIFKKKPGFPDKLNPMRGQWITDQSGMRATSRYRNGVPRRTPVRSESGHPSENVLFKLHKGQYRILVETVPMGNTYRKRQSSRHTRFGCSEKTCRKRREPIHQKDGFIRHPSFVIRNSQLFPEATHVR